MTPSGSRWTFAWWVAIGVAEMVLAIALLVYGYWWTLFVSFPATAICGHFARREWERLKG